MALAPHLHSLQHSSHLSKAENPLFLSGKAAPVTTDRYLRTSLLVVRHSKRLYALFHPGSSVALLTDTIGAAVGCRLVAGWSEHSVRGWLNRKHPGSDPQLTQLLERLAIIGSLTDNPPGRTLKWRTRVFASLALSGLLSIALAVLPHLPVRLLCWLLNALPSTPLVSRTVGQIEPFVTSMLDASGYAERSSEWKHAVACGSAATSARTSVLLVVAHAATRQKIATLTSLLVDPRSSRALRQALTESDGAIVAGLHSDVFVMPFSQSVVWDLPTLGIADEAATLMPFEPDSALTLNAYLGAQLLSTHSPMTMRTLVRHLVGGGVVHILFDAVLEKLGGEAATVRFLGRRLRRVDGPAWLAVRTGKPIVFVGVYRAGSRVGYDISPPLHANAALLERSQLIADLSERVYMAAEAFVRRHPEAWMGWSYLPMLLAEDHDGGEPLTPTAGTARTREA